MPRQKNYDEEVVTEKAMKLFWSNGFGATSARMLEKEMGINLFSIYSSFHNKEGVLLASMKCYKKLMRTKLLTPLSERLGTPDSIKIFFYDFLKFTKDKNLYRGCLLINSANEMGSNMNEEVAKEINLFSKEILNCFTNILSVDKKKHVDLVKKQASYLFVALQGVVLAAKTNGQKSMRNYIEMTFQMI